MRHGKKINHLGRTASHRRSMLANMASSLIKHKKITTTVAKAKALRTYVEPLITKGKENSVHNNRTVFSYLGDKEAVHELFSVVGEKVASRPGGYTRILKIGNRAGDNADMAIIELVDFNEYFTGFGKEKKGGARKTRRGRSGSATTVKTTAPAVETTAVVEEPVAEAVEEVTAIAEVEVPAVEEAVEATVEQEVETVAEVVNEETEEVQEVTATAEETAAPESETSEDSSTESSEEDNKEA